MTTILHINSSAQTSERSYTRKMGKIFLDQWREHEPDVKVIDRDVATDNIGPVDQDFIAAAFTKPEERTAEMVERLKLSDTLVDEIIAADVIVMGAPMYNYNVPASLKAWIDQIARIGRTFSFDLARGDVPIEPILSGKKLVVLSSRGEFGFEPGGMRADMNALDTGIAASAHYLGAKRDEIMSAVVEYQEFGDERHEKSVEQAYQKTKEIADQLAQKAAQKAA